MRAVGLVVLVMVAVVAGAGETVAQVAGSTLKAVSVSELREVAKGRRFGNVVVVAGKQPLDDVSLTRVAARAEDQPFCFIHGIVTEPTVAALPAVEPATSPIAADPAVET